jgi:hypothetical protein
MQQCKVCEKEFETLDKLRRHNSRVHKISSQEFYDEYILNGEIPKCKCGCGETPTFITFTKGYNEWIKGHISRVNNNWGHNQKAIDNSAQTRREQYENGEREVWNIGLTKETDERVKINGEKVSESISNNPKEIERRREWLSNARKNNPKFASKYGKDSANWKGGYSSIATMIYANKRLYKKWKYPKLVESKFSCTNCGGKNELHIHHDKEMMSEIVYKFIDKDKEYSWNEKRSIMKKVIDYHINENVSGKVLCKNCHKEEHPSYNF